MSQTKKEVRFYSKEEMKFVNDFAKSKAPVTEEALQEFCTKYNRGYKAVMVKIYILRKKLKDYKAVNKTNTPKASLVKDKSVAKISKGEFKIPITNWNVSSEDGQFYFVVKF